MSTKLKSPLLILAVALLGLAWCGAAMGTSLAPTPPQAGREEVLPILADASSAPGASPGSRNSEGPAAPEQIFQQMCDYLKNQPRFSFKAEVYNDRVYAEGRKLQYGLDMEAFFKRPDKFRINGSGDRENKELIFDGKNITLYNKNKNHFGVIEFEGDTDAALDKAHNEYGLRVGLAELGSVGLSERIKHGLTNSLYVGESKVRGVYCHHLALDKEKVHFQLWIEAGDKPLLRKVVVTQKNLPYAPQWTAFISDWNFSPNLVDSLFTFTPPDGAKKVRFSPVEKTKAPAPKNIKKKEKGGAP